MRFKILLLFLFSLYAFGMSAQNASVRGRVLDAETSSPVGGVSVILEGTDKSTISDEDGRFELLNIAPGDYVLRLQTDDYALVSMDISPQSGTLNLGVIDLAPQTEAGQINPEDFIPTITLSDDDLEQESNNQNISGILSASQDVFVSAAAFTFGPMRFRIRGYDAENTMVFLNGMPFNELESGRVFWSIWGGLNDVTRNRDTDVGMAPMGYTIGGIGGGTAIDTRASTQRTQKRFSYSMSNRSYRQRLMATYSTGWLEGDWAISLSGSRRWAEEGYVAGTFYDAWSYFASVDKKFNEQHMLNLTAFGAPVKRGRSTSTVQEMYDLAGTNYYNPFWGYQNGKKRNARVVDAHQPVIMLRHDWNISESALLTTTAGVQLGYYGSGAIDWFDAPDPRPDFYRYLPSFLQSENSEAAEIQAATLANSEGARQLNWDDFYYVNRNSQLSEKYSNLIEGQNYSGNWSQYILENRHYDSHKFNFNSNYQHVMSDQFTLSGGLLYQMQTVKNYKVVEDLLGGDFYVNIDRFAVRDSIGNPDAQQNNLDNPSEILGEGDTFGYNYDSNIRRGEIWAQGAWSLRSVDFSLSGQLSQTTFWRTGYYRNGRFPDNSLGDSEKQNFTNFGLKGGVTYKLSGRHYLYANGMYKTRAPFFRNAYVSPRTRDQVVPNLKSETIYSGEAGYYLRSPGLKGRATVYYTQFRDQVRIIRFYNDFDRAFGNLIMSGVDRLHVGTELALEAKLSAEFSVSAVAALGRYTYNSRASGALYQDNGDDIVGQAPEFTIYNKNFYVPGMPQSAYTLGLNYNSPNYWFAKLSFNYFDDIWIDYSPIRRTTDAVAGVDPESELYREIIEQERADPGFTVDFFGGKSFKFGDYYLYLNLGVNNLLNNQSIITGGFEQLRFDVRERNVDAYPPRYFYSYGTNFFANVSLRF